MCGGETCGGLASLPGWGGGGLGQRAILLVFLFM